MSDERTIAFNLAADAESAAIDAAAKLRDGLPEQFGFLLLVFRIDGQADDGFAMSNVADDDIDHIISHYQATRRASPTN